MKIIRRAVLDWDGNVLEEDAYEYSGPIAQCKDSGSPPAPVDPYTQASAQYGLDTGTANYNAALNRTNSANPLGSSSWNITGYDGSGAGGIPGTNSNVYGLGGGSPPSTTPNNGGGYGGSYLLGSSGLPMGGAYGPSTGRTPAVAPGRTMGFGGGSGAPRYTQTTSLTPWANKMLSSPIDTSGLAGMPGGPSTTGDLNLTRNALYDTQESYLKPQQDLAHEQLLSQLANEGATPGSAAWKTALDQEGRQNTFTNNQAIDSAITGGGQEQSRLFGLGSQGLQNQLAVRNAPISEYEALQGNPSAQVSAATPDISGAFGQQYSGALAGYNANQASNNATTSTVGSLAMMAAMYF